MRVAFETLGLVSGRVGGMETYVRELWRALLSACGNHEFLLLTGKAAGEFAGDSGQRPTEFVADALLPSPLHHLRPLVSASQWLASDRRLRQWGYDVLHSTMSFPRPPWRLPRRVLTIHDLVAECHPATLRWHDRLLMRTFYRLGCRSAERVITISERYRELISKRFGVPSFRVHVIHLGVDRGTFFPLTDPAGREALRARLGQDSPFLLYPANTWPHKNHLRLLEALAILRSGGGPRPRLLLAGSEKLGHTALLDSVADSGLSDQVRWLGFVPPAALGDLYRAAEALIFPSLFEGFGAPLVEAMAAGCPVLCSRETASDDVAAGASLTFDPRDPQAIAATIRQFLDSSGARENLRRAGLARARRFSWEAAAAATLEVYELAAGPHRAPAA